MKNFHVLGLCGSLRRHSLNRHAMHAAAACLPDGLHFTEARHDEVPLFNQDVQDTGMPVAVTRLGEQVRAADALLIASPEYNFSISGVLKNTIDWLTRLPHQPFKDKPVAILSATMGPLGGGRHQYELRKILGSQDALVLTRPEVFINFAHTKFDAEGRLTDEATRKVLADQMAAFALWIARLRP